MSDTVAGDGAASKYVEPGDDELRDAEKWWRDHYGLFEAHGYRLRSRYRPGWIPPWKTSGKNRMFYEEHYWCMTDNVMHAVRITDGTVVSIKRIKRNSRELSIALLLSPAKDRDTNPMNHCVPILDHFNDDALPDLSFLVMPLLRRFYDPPFFSTDEVVEFMKQTLEGLSYIHSRGVAHRDCSDLNIMLEASSMYPRGFHPVVKLKLPSGKKLAPYYHRRDVQGVKYYFIDFGISSQFEANVGRHERLVTGIHGQDRDVPELSDRIPYDPFAVDVFILGNVYRTKFLDEYYNLSFLSDLVSAMTASKPEQRPSVDDALAQFNALVASRPGIHLRWRLKDKESGFVRRVVIDMDSVAREGLHLIKKIIKTPITSLRK